MKGKWMAVLTTAMATGLSVGLVHAASVEPRRVENQRGIFYVFTPPEPEKTAEYIASRHKLLDQLFFQEPGKTYEAQISFSRYLNEADVLALSRRHSFTITTLNFGWAGQTGGHSLERNEGLDSAFKKVRLHYEGLLIDLEDSITRKRTTALTSDDKRRLNALSEHADKLRVSYQGRGTQYFGAKVYGAVETLKFSKDGDSTIRLMDVLWSQESDASGASGIRKLSVPIVPESR